MARSGTQVGDKAPDTSGRIHFKVDGVEINIPYTLIDRAKLVFVYTKGQKK